MVDTTDTKSSVGHEDVTKEEVNLARQRLGGFKEALVKRILARNNQDQEWGPDLRAHPDQYAPLDGSKVQWELMVARMLATHLLDPSTTMPIDVDTLHRRVAAGSAGPDYQRCMNLLGFSGGPQPILARLCHQNILEALQLQPGPKTGGGPRQMWIVRLERAALANLVGIVDPMPAAPAMMPSLQPGLATGMPLIVPAPAAGPRPPMPPTGPMPPQQPFMPPVNMGPGILPNPMLPNQMLPPGIGGTLGSMDNQGQGMPGIMMDSGQNNNNNNQGGVKREADMDLGSLLAKKTQRDRMQLDSGSGAELQAVLARPTAREAAKMEVFRTADGASAIQEHCPNLTKEDCKRANNSPVACNRVHFKRIIRPHTDLSLGNCSYLNTCRNFHRCKYIHYDIDDEEVPVLPPGLFPPGMEPVLSARNIPSGVSKTPPVPKYLQALKEPQWINCDIRKLDMKVLGKFGVIMADPPWQIHQDLPYGTMEDEEMRKMDIGCLQDDGVIFLWVTGRAMELGRECLKIWGYDRVDELIWVKTNQLNRLIRTGRTGHWLNHSKEHCLIGVKGKPNLNKFVDCDVVVAEVRETSRKPDEMYPLLERLSPGTRKLEIFAREHNRMPGWVGLGNQLPGVEILEPEFRQRYIARYGPPGPDGKLPLPY